MGRAAPEARCLQFKDQYFIYSDNNYLDLCDILIVDPRNRMGIFKET